MSDQNFWKPQPKEPWLDWRTYSMLLPIAAGALGACIFFALGLAFAEIVNIRAEVRKPLIFVASFGVAIGATFGSIGSGIEVFRKSYKKQAKSWDWVSLAVSTVTTIVGMIIGVATLLGGTTTWSQQAVIWGSAAVCGLAALDAAGDMIELGGLFGSYEERVERWRAEREQWRKENGLGLVQDRDALTQRFAHLAQRIKAVDQELDRVAKFGRQVNERWSWPVASASQIEQATKGTNGDRADLTREELSLVLAEQHLNLPSVSTIKRGLGGRP